MGGENREEPLTDGPGSTALGYFRAGQAFIEAGKRDEALILVGELLRLDPLSPLAFALLRDMHKRKYRSDVACPDSVSTAQKM